jgi:purine nucleosidase
VERIIIDTDIGSDPDDALAIALAMKSPEIIIEGITIVNGDIEHKARMAHKILSLGECSDIRVIPGISNSLLKNRTLYANGQEGEGFVSPDDTTIFDGHAVDFIIEKVMNNPGEISLVAIGPLTNIAAAMIREPKISRMLKRIYLMGGVKGTGDHYIDLPLVEYNIKCDPEAASVVFASGTPILMVGLDVTMKLMLTKDMLNQIKNNNSPLNGVLAGIVERWLTFIGGEATPMHDPLALALVINPNLVKTQRMNVVVEYSHDRSSGQTVASPNQDGYVSVACQVNEKQFFELLLSRLA